MTSAIVDLPEELRRHIAIDAQGCWVWQRSLTAHGYGQVVWQGKHTAAHRVVCDMLKGPLPEGLERDHTCRNRACCNPAHIEYVTHAENIRRGDAPVRLELLVYAVRREQPCCVHGHEFTAKNTYRKPNGTRACKECGKLRMRARRAAT